ncbi:hypothetical protein PIB30_016184 [Stylosanthes scabra]|uniref:PHD-type domain-containing protein n=1 Tax=Stylosanthes scabra TaxID=79078 RepID=A0ABU6U8U1_9FABA|nr:hypothetical protein [Stylosanthes scabra]
MREGLRSQTRLRNVCTGGGGDVKSVSFDLGGEDSQVGGEALGSLVEEKVDNVDERGAKEECNADLRASTSGKGDAGSAEDGGNGGGEDDGVEKRMVEHEVVGLNGTVTIGGRVLRSRTKRLENEKPCSGGSGGGVVVSGRGGGRGGFRRVTVKKECQGDGEYFPNGCGNAGVGPKKKGKRGRPRKVKLEESNELALVSCGNEEVELKKNVNGRKKKRKRGRPPKVKVEEPDKLVEQLPRKRGRPPKDHGQNHLAIVVHEHDRKVNVSHQKGKKGLTERVDAKANVIGYLSSRRSSQRTLEKKGTKVLETEGNGVCEGISGEIMEERKKKRGKEGRKQEKQLVREKIMEQILAAGWTVDYRPRNGREYMDAVYVSPDGKTHWSITLAYNRLKKHYEAGDGEGKVYGSGFKFTPISEEEYQMLTKVITKERKSKKKKMKNGVKGKKLKKGKAASHAGMGKSAKRKKKRKRREEDDTDMFPNKVSVLGRDHKRHKTQSKKRGAPLVRNAEVDVDSEADGYVPYCGKRTVLAWMIDLGTILQDVKVHYMQLRENSVLLDGKITGDGIHCGCCNEVITISDFEAHAGIKYSDPLRNIHIEGGTSLLQCLLDSWNKQDESERKGFHFVDVAGEDPNDDTCGVCGDGGDLICCDGCPSTFHQSCLDINKFPSGDWHCVYCCCKFCGLVGGSSNQTDNNDGSAMSTLLTCHLCEEKYHIDCSEENGAKDDDARDASFCGNTCQELSERLEMLLGVKHEIEDGFSMTLVRRSDVAFDVSQTKPEIVECNSKLAVALSVMNECFMPYIDERSGIDLIHSILYNCGSNFKRLNYSGFVTAILERGDEIIAAATIRIHGNQLAEMPFIGTRFLYRRQGMCRRLLNAIECALSSLNVELLVIPAVSEVRETWTSAFGFEPLELANKKIIKSMSLLVFPHVDMLQKKISKHKFAEETAITTEASYLLLKDHAEGEVANNCARAESLVSDSMNDSADIPSNDGQIKDKTMSTESGSVLPEGSLNNGNTKLHDKCPEEITCQVVCQENLSVEDKNTSCDCVELNDDEKPVDLDGQSNNFSEETECLRNGCPSGEAVPTTNDSVRLKSKDITEDCPDNCETNSKMVSTPIPDEAEKHPAETPKLQTDTEDCQSFPVSSDLCEKIVDCADETSKPSSAGEADSLPADTNRNPNNEHLTKGSAGLPEHDLQVDQNPRTLCTPNTASSVALNCASVGASSASCSSTEVMVLSNQAS